MNSPIKELLKPLPGYKILHVSDRIDTFAYELLELLEEVGGKLQVVLYENTNETDVFKIQYVINYNEQFRALPREYDVVILYNVFSKHSKQEQLIKNTYQTLANAAYIIIIEKHGIMELSLLKETLERMEFRAANEIDLIEDYDLVMAKKMHMWGAGL